jgi:hypothetical protein
VSSSSEDRRVGRRNRFLNGIDTRHRASDGRATQTMRRAQPLIDGSSYMDAQGRSVFSYAHPIFWPPFSLIGDRG